MAGNGPVRINVGCGRHTPEGWINCDVVRAKRAKRDPDLFCDFRAIPLPDGCADEVHAIHVFEHVYRWESDALLKEWKRLLKPGGMLVLEMPDLIKCCKNILLGLDDKYSYWGLYGNPQTEDVYMCHRWGWTPKTLELALIDNGFHKVRQETPQWHMKAKDIRDMRMVALKP